MGKYVDTLIELFQTFDQDNSSMISLQEFETGLEDIRMQAILKTLDIERRDALSLFDMLDADTSGEVSIDEFISGCIKFRGGAKAVQIEKVGKEWQHMNKKVK